jgi:hypothetical protein
MIFQKFQKNFRCLLSKQYLDFAESLPSFNGGLIAKLQEIRKSQRENSQYFFNEINSSQNREINLSRIHLIEVFNVEDFDELKIQIKNIFPDLSNNIIADSSLFDNFSNQDLSVVWENEIGKIVPKHLRSEQIIYHENKNTRYLDDLPEEVKYIEVRASQILPSLIIILFNIEFDIAATSKFSLLKTKKPLSVIEFSNIFPWMLRKSPHCENSDLEPFFEIYNKYFEDLQSKVENCLYPYFRGHFYKNFRREKLKFLSVRVFTVERSNNLDISFNNWLVESKSYFNIYGNHIFNSILHSRIFYKNGITLIPSANKKLSCIFLDLNFFANEKNLSGYTTPENMSYHKSLELIVDISPSLTIFELISTLENHLGRDRLIVFKKINRNFIGSLFRPKKSFDLINKNLLIMERLIMEMRQNRRLLSRMNKTPLERVVIKKVGGNDFIGCNKFRISEQPDDVKESLSEFISSQIKYKQNYFLKYSRFIKVYYSEYLSQKNTEAINTLTWAATIIGFLSFMGFDRVKKILFFTIHLLFGVL